MSSGEEKGWEILSDLEPPEVCENARVSYDPASGLYSLRAFQWNVSVSPAERKIFSKDSESDVLLKNLGYFSKLSVLWYLVSAKNIPLSEKLVKPADLKGGEIFFRGTHVLPLERIAGHYNNDPDRFISKGSYLRAETLGYGDASLRLFPLPRVPVVLILWRGDEEFSPLTDLLFDSTCEFHIPLDIIWSVAMMSVLIMM
jgi:hypothetical protein